MRIEDKSFKIRACLPNMLTALRLILTPIFALLAAKICSGGSILYLLCLTLLFALICASDMIDGRLARKWGTQTRFGALLDVAADSSFIFLSSLVLTVNGVIPIWFVAVVAVNFAVFIATSRVMSTSKNQPFVFDIAGRAAAAGFYAVPFVSIVFYMLNMSIMILIITAVIASLAILSFVQRIVVTVSHSLRRYE